MKELIKELKFWEMSHKLKSTDREDLRTIISKMENQLTIPVVVGQSEQLFCGDLIKHNFSLSKIGRCIICDREKDKAT